MTIRNLKKKSITTTKTTSRSSYKFIKTIQTTKISNQNKKEKNPNPSIIKVSKLKTLKQEQKWLKKEKRGQRRLLIELDGEERKINGDHVKRRRR